MNFSHDPWVVVAAVVVGVLGAARLTRIAVADKFPPAAWVRSAWDRVTRDGDWSLLVHCHWCLGPWMFALSLGTGLVSDLHPVWWIFWGWLAGAYLTSMVVEFDEKD